MDGYEKLWERFMKYKNRVPVCGGILLDSACENCVLVKGWKSSASWGFPKGKINDEEERWQCAVREVSIVVLSFPLQLIPVDFDLALVRYMKRSGMT